MAKQNNNKHNDNSKRIEWNTYTSLSLDNNELYIDVYVKIQVFLLIKMDLEAIYNERRHEFAFEMHRWYDLLRHPNPNYFIDVMRASGKTNIQEKHRYMPIPQNEIDKNANLTQNTGY
jgi:hypothetical protein